MLVSISSFKDFPMDCAFEIYGESIRKRGEKQFGYASEERQHLLAQEDFYLYLRDIFFGRKDSRYYFWQEDGHLVSALRVEPHEDGLLIEAMETMPGMRGRGYAGELLKAVLEDLKENGAAVVYSHIDKRNTASIAVHKKCGFYQIRDYAALIDGSVSNRYATFIFELKK